jgi:hypothetical protein
MLTIPADKLVYIIEKAREFDAQVTPTIPDSGSNPSDDGGGAILEDTPDNPAREQLTEAIDALDPDQKIELLALTWLGRGDFAATEWRAALKQAREIRDEHETDYLVGTPLLGDYLAEAAATLGRPL